MKKLIKEFRDFINQGDVMDMAVGIIVGGAFSSIVKSLTTNLINPLLGFFIGKINFSSLVLQVGQAKFQFGEFINSVINFIIISFIVFLLVKFVNKFKKSKNKTNKKTNPEIDYLKDIKEILEKNLDSK